MGTKSQDALRKKFLSILPRHMLESLSQLERPWHADKSALITAALSRWNHEEVSQSIREMLDRAKP